ncbi:MAG: alginate lyase family protein [Clostridia bacterium]|nr:alginate lyase family protein [Clostridia bacterium]
MDITRLLPVIAPLAETKDIAHKYAVHLDELLSSIRPEAIDDAYQAALAKEDIPAAVRACAAHFRAKPDAGAPSLDIRSPYSKDVADRAVRGEMRVINIDWTFENGRINYLFDPTELKGPRNYEWVWQLNRHSFWWQMAAAYRETGNETYALAFERQLLDWIAQTDCPEKDWNAPGSAWRTIECGIRLMGSWQIAFQTFRHSSRVSDLSLLLMLASMRRQAAHLVAHPHIGNWLMMESTGVFTFSALYPEFREAEEFRETAVGRFLREMDLQILPDGMHNELTPDYQSVVWGCAANIYDVACHEGFRHEFPRHFVELMERTVHAAILLSTPAFTQPRTNDCYTIHTRTFTSRADQLLPPSAEYDFVNSNRRDGRPPEGKTASAFLPYAGFCVMRSGWDENAAYLCFDVGPLGRMHIHQDKLNINIYKGGEELIFDDGGGQYEISEARKYGISAYDHNTVLVDGLGQNRREPLVSSDAIDAGWVSNDRFDYAQGTYDQGFGPDMLPLARHIRRVRFEKPGFFCVQDSLTSADGSEHEYEVLFHLNTLKVDRLEAFPGAMISDFGKTYDVLILPIGDGQETGPTVVSGQTEPFMRGWYVGRNEETLHKAATVGRKSFPSLSHTFNTLIFPIKRGDALPEVHRSGSRLTIVFNGQTHEIDLDALNR